MKYVIFCSQLQGNKIVEIPEQHIIESSALQPNWSETCKKYGTIYPQLLDLKKGGYSFLYLAVADGTPLVTNIQNECEFNHNYGSSPTLYYGIS